MRCRAAAVGVPETAAAEAAVLDALRRIIDPDFGADVVECGFVKDLRCSPSGAVAFALELTTPVRSAS